MEQNELSKSNKIKIIIVTTLIFLVAISGISYAYFTIQVVGNDTASSMRLTTANLSLVYTDVNIVSGENVIPGWSQTKTLTVENDGTDTVRYNIIWRELYNEFINDELVISATCSSSSGSCSDIPETVIPTYTTETNNVNLRRGIEIAPGVIHTYTVTVTFKETGVSQNYNQNKQFYGTLNIGEGSEPARLSIKTDQGTIGKIDRGDEITLTTKKKLSTGEVVTISGEDFYVVSSDASKTVLLAKYNLYVGDILNRNGSTLSLNKTLSSSDDGYGLQSSEAIGCTTDKCVGVAAFSGTNYWDNQVCEWVNGSQTCTGASALKANYSINGASYDDPPYPYVYESAMSNVAQSLGYTNGYGVAQNNGYTVAYYVDEYLKRLEINGSGRLLTYEEAKTLETEGSDILYNGSQYWTGSVANRNNVWYVRRSGSPNYAGFAYDMSTCVRPVIVLPTSDIKSS